MDPLKPLIDALHSEGRLRVWSLVITVFGDLVQHRGGVISTARLGQVMGRIGIERGTLRTALSRLGRDGWVESERAGRTSFYRLSAQGLARFAPATTLIYASPQPAPMAAETVWSMYVTLSGSAPRVGLTMQGHTPDDADCIVTGQLAHISPAWRAHLFGDEMRRAVEALGADIAALGSARLSDPLDAAAARVMLIHRWRRLVLRHGEPVVGVMPEDVALQDPRDAVARAYVRLAPMAEQWLDHPHGDDAAMPVADAGFSDRFGGIAVPS